MLITDILIRLAVSLVLGGAIGLERELSNKPAGLRTNILICTGATMMMALSGMILAAPAAGGSDLLRVAAGVITGIGFMGAGTIIRAGGHVQGLTTASTLWAVTALGLVVGAGYYLVAVVFTAMIVLTLALFRKVEAAVPKRRSYAYTLKIPDMDATADKIGGLAASSGIRIESVNLKRAESAVLMTFGFVARERAERHFRHDLSDSAEILEIRQP
ncbi:MAG: MgtC/SapB family protein [Candidatus Aminicenantes bacterium]|nr:MgtC/SapB family protein [Candidatus Aminicenantes bacterium]